jgi:hypothetical protein
MYPIHPDLIPKELARETTREELRSVRSTLGKMGRSPEKMAKSHRNTLGKVAIASARWESMGK